ncbi:hypothetical protein BJ508DRAFT_412255 [Ascobolus immersus RN42]|uniref:Uncharacterized protein n=1 Tax=Ascobolus immersus RN42 TaxID=1160509 RepID=A0A3N4II67_ASCIM|nr:hypothetical protein BJ508DRAFT_412255 [Ascobolus immersus RN42]
MTQWDRQFSDNPFPQHWTTRSRMNGYDSLVVAKDTPQQHSLEARESMNKMPRKHKSPQDHQLPDNFSNPKQPLKEEEQDLSNELSTPK